MVNSYKVVIKSSSYVFFIVMKKVFLLLFERTESLKKIFKKLFFTSLFELFGVFLRRK